jgi:hypothetical protein
LIEGVKKNLKLAPFIVVANVIKDYLIALVVVFSVEFSLWQIIVPLVLILTVALFTIIKKPYEICLENVFHFVSNISYLSVLIIFLVLDRFTDDMSLKDRYQYLGTCCVLLICLILILNLAFALCMIIRSIFIARKKNKEQKSELKNKMEEEKIAKTQILEVENK